MSEKFKYILLDWDGCLADTLGIWLDATREQLNKYDVFMTDADIVANVFGNWAAFKNKISEENRQKAVDDLVAQVNLKLHKVPLHLEVKDTLVKLKSLGKNLAIVSSSRKETVMPALEFHAIVELVDTIICVDDVTHYKPDPEGINKALVNMHGTKEKAIIIGDSEKDVLAGKNAGIASCIFYPDVNHYFYSHAHLKALNPNFIINNFSELLNIL